MGRPVTWLTSSICAFIFDPAAIAAAIKNRETRRIFISSPKGYSGSKLRNGREECYRNRVPSQEIGLSGRKGVVSGYFGEVAGVVDGEDADVVAAADLEAVDAAV